VSDLKDALAVSELSPRTTQSVVRKAYRKLLKVWHPDRFIGDPELQVEAEEGTKRTTRAYGTVMDYLKPRQDGAHTGPSTEEARGPERDQQRRRGKSEQADRRRRQAGCSQSERWKQEERQARTGRAHTGRPLTVRAAILGLTFAVLVTGSQWEHAHASNL